jgi:hypothetical protein
MIEDIQIGETRRLEDRAPSQDALEITVHEDLYRAFITDVRIERPRKILVRVDSFGFLYSLVHQAYLLEISPSVQIEIGEGLSLVGRKLESSEVALELQYGDFCISQCNMTNAQFLVLLSLLISRLVGSIRAIGVDVDDYVRRFPPSLF